MSAKDSITTQTCELSQEEFNDFLALYPVPSEYHVVLPKSNQIGLDAPPGYVGLYTHSFSLSNLRLPLTEFFCEVLEYFQVHISRLNPFGCAKLTTFVVMCKAYGCEPSVDLFRGFFNLCQAGKWLTFAKRSEKHILNLLPEVITGIEGWHERLFYVQDSIIPANRYPTSVRVFPDPILFLAGLKPSWEHCQQRPAIMAGGKEDEDLMFLPKEPSPGFGTGSPSILVNTKPLKANKEPDIQLVEVTTDSRGSLKPELKLASGSSTSRATRSKTSSSKEDDPLLTVFDDDEGLPDVLELKDANACHLKISAITPLAWKNHLDNHIDLELLDLHDRCYARQAVVDNVVNKRSRELLQVIKKLKGECVVMRSRERARDEECEGLRVKCEAAMTDFEKNPAVVALREKIYALSTEAKEYKLEAVEVSIRKEVEELKQDRREVVSKVVPYAAMELVYSDDIGSLVGKLVSSAILYGRCRAFEQVAGIKEPFDLSKLDKFVADPSTPIEALLSKKPLTLHRPTPSRTQVPLVSSQRATPSFVPASNLISPPADASVVKPQSSHP
ncbi:hypothetical protein Tco_1055831 [Tanacetum coccineum]|uniref:Transposase (putative) gypsy type domain-containing protein n=1 Tax=Tanacetum coccineum TaxID=301880 RepID=A0ABQ5H103_9ASTR